MTSKEVATISSKERLLRSIRHRPVDRVPISTYELVGWNMDAWENKEPSYKKVMDYIRANTDCVYMLNPGLREVPNKALEIEQWREGPSRFTKRIYATKLGKLESLHRDDDSVNTTWTIKHLLEDISDIDSYLAMPYNPPEFNMDVFDREREKLGNKGLMMISIEDPICLAAELFEMSKFLIYAITEYTKIKYFLDAIHKRQMYSLKMMLKHDMKDVIFRICGPEYATPPYLSPDYFYNLVTCYLIEICNEIKAAGAIPRIHCHGKVAKVLEQFAETEADCIDPVEPPPDGDIHLSEVKKLYGDRFCIFGNIEIRELEQSSEDRIEQLVKEAMDAAKRGRTDPMGARSPEQLSRSSS